MVSPNIIDEFKKHCSDSLIKHRLLCIWLSGYVYAKYRTMFITGMIV